MSQGRLTNTGYKQQMFGYGFVITLLLAYFANGIDEVKAAPQTTLAPAEGQPASAETKTLFKEITELVKGYFPKAKVTTTAKSIHFEYLVHERLHPYTRRTVLSPDLDGILGDIEIKAALPKDASLPVERPETVHSVLLMAPYSAPDKSCLSTRLVFQPVTPLDFVDAFKQLIASYSKEDEASAVADSNDDRTKAPTSTNADTPAITSAPETPAATTVTVKPVPPSVVGTASVPASTSDPVTTTSSATTAATTSPATTPPATSHPSETTAHLIMTKYTYPEGHFRVMLPGSPQVKYTDQSGMRMVDYVYTEPEGTFNISYVILPEPPSNLKTSQLLDNMSQSVVNSLKGLHARQYPSALQGYPGCQLEMAELTGKPGHSARFRIYIVKNFVYIVGLAGKKDWLNSPNAKEFLDTFLVNP